MTDSKLVQYNEYQHKIKILPYALESPAALMAKW